MRQAGRYQVAYRELRAKHSMLEVIHTPELAAQVTMLPIDQFNFDAAIIFADILPVLTGMGLNIDFIKGKGPVVHNPLRENRDIDLLAAPPAEEFLGSTLQAIELVKAELAPRDIPLIGFAGAPFTLASYAIEGGSTKNFKLTKALMYSEPAAWDRLMTKLVTVNAEYLIKQAGAGADALQIFDSWAGALSRADYIRFVQPYNKKLFQMAGRANVPLLHYSKGTAGYLDVIAATGGDVIGVDWQLPLAEAWGRIGEEKSMMGNLDPVALFAPWRELKFQVDEVLDSAGNRPGYIFNLGHGILPETPIENVRRLVDYVHERTERSQPGGNAV
jgi:uroporphyrinogen decarboxylase